MKCSSMAIVFMSSPEPRQEKRAEAYTMAAVIAAKPALARGLHTDPVRGPIARHRLHDNCIGQRMVLGCRSMKIFRWRVRVRRPDEREVRAAAGGTRHPVPPGDWRRDAAD